MSDMLEVKVPDIGDFDAVEIVDVMVAVGDTVALEDSLITLETDKAAMDIPSPAAGVIKEMRVELGGTISEGDIVLVLEVEESVTVAAEPAAEAAPAAAAPVAATQSAKQAVQSVVQTPAPIASTVGVLPPINEAGFAAAHASPSIRRFARELGVNLMQVKGSGAKARILKDDVKAFVKAVMQGQVSLSAAPALPELPKVDHAKFGEIETKPLGRIQKISGPRLHASWVNIPHVTQTDDADTTELEAKRKAMKADAEAQGVKLTPLAFIVKASVLALQEFPVFNTSMGEDQKSLIYKKYINIGFAADTPNGLMVPVIHNAEQKTLFEIASELIELSALAREGKLGIDKMQGGTFTISSLGGIGGGSFTPIINPPEVAILGASRSKMTPVWNGSEFEPRLMLPLSLSYDHRVIDGATGARFITYLSQTLADVDKLI
ncbi:MAG: dihydrolipoyllysine-residue acetyltransferase [Gammaproteobacteria bacterium]|nr:dihydrolipoyllysine-residue acetyltransferase [Gammaproteobacteria bacterium]